VKLFSSHGETDLAAPTRIPGRIVGNTEDGSRVGESQVLNWIARQSGNVVFGAQCIFDDYALPFI